MAGKNNIAPLSRITKDFMERFTVDPQLMFNAYPVRAPSNSHCVAGNFGSKLLLIARKVLTKP